MQHRLALAGAIVWLIARMVALYWGLHTAAYAFSAATTWVVILISFAVGIWRSEWLREHAPEFAGLTELVIVLWVLNWALLAFL